MKKSNVRKVFSPAICDDLSVAVKMFSTAPGEWLDGLIRGLSTYSSREDARRSIAAADAMIRCVGDIEKLFPTVTEKAENLNTAIRRFSEAIINSYGEDETDALFGPRARLRDAGDAFSAAVAQIAATQKSKRGRKSKCDFKILGPFFKEAREIINRQPKCATGNEGPQRGSIRDVFALLLSKPEYEVINRSYFVIGHDGKVCESGMGNLMRAFREWKKRNGYNDEIRPKKKNGKGPRRSSARAKQVKRKM